MGQGGSSSVKLCYERITITGEALAKSIGYGSCQQMKTSLQDKRDKRLADLASGKEQVTDAQLLQGVHVSSTWMPAATVKKTICFGETIRRISSARRGQLAKSFFESGIITTDGSNLTVYLDFEGGEGVQLVAIGGHHRSRAAVDFYNALANLTCFDWEGSNWETSNGGLKDAFGNGNIPVTLLYLGKHARSLRINVALALNDGHLATFATNFHDRLTLVRDLCAEGGTVTTILKTCTEFINLAPNTGRFYVTALRRLSQNEKAVGKLEAYFDACVDDKGFFNMSKFHSDPTLGELRRRLGDKLGDLFFVTYILRFQPRSESGVIVDKRTGEGKADMLRCVGPIEPLVADLQTRLSLETTKEKVGKTFNTDDTVTACFGSLLDELDSFVVGHDGHRNISSDQVRDLLPPALRTALWGSVRTPSETGMSERLAICRAVLAPEEAVGTVDPPDNVGSSASRGSAEVGRKDENTHQASNETPTDGGEKIGRVPSSVGDSVTARDESKRKEVASTTKKRSLSFDPSLSLLATLSANSLAEAISKSERSEGPCILVWDSLESPGPKGLRGFVRALRRSPSWVHRDSCIVIVNDSLRRVKGDDADGTQSKELLAETIKAATEESKVTGVKTQKEAFVTRLQARLDGAFLLNAATFLGAGKAKKYRVEARTPAQAPMEVFIVQTVFETVGLFEGDPSLQQCKNGTIDPLSLAGPKFCRIEDDPSSLRMAHRHDSRWETFLKGNKLAGKQLSGRTAPERRKHPSVSTLEGIIYRAGATSAEGVVAIVSDPFAAWIEACQRIGVSCVSYLGRKPNAYVKGKIETMWNS